MGGEGLHDDAAELQAAIDAAEAKLAGLEQALLTAQDAQLDPWRDQLAEADARVASARERLARLEALQQRLAERLLNSETELIRQRTAAAPVIGSTWRWLARGLLAGLYATGSVELGWYLHSTALVVLLISSLPIGLIAAWLAGRGLHER